MARAGEAHGDFAAFFERHHRELGRLAYLLTSDHGAADDLTGDVLLAAWQQWPRIRGVDQPLAYVRRMMANNAASRVRSLVRERSKLSRLRVADRVDAPDTAAVVTVQNALEALPAGRRACVVLRHAFDMSEREVAKILGVSVGTVKSQTAKGVAQLTAALDIPAPRRSSDWAEPEPPRGDTGHAGTDRRAGCGP